MSRSECQPRDGTQRLAGSARLSALPLAALADGSIGASLPTFHVKAADRARVAYMPGTALPVTGSPPDSSWNLMLAPVLMPPETNFDTSTAIRLRSPSRSPPDASRAPFPTRSRQRSSANAAVGGVTPLPEERRRRATTFIFHAAAHQLRSPTYIPTSPSARVAHARSGSWPPSAPGRGQPARPSGAPAPVRPGCGTGTSRPGRRLMPRSGLCRGGWRIAWPAWRRRDQGRHNPAVAVGG